MWSDFFWSSVRSPLASWFRRTNLDYARNRRGTCSDSKMCAEIWAQPSADPNSLRLVGGFVLSHKWGVSLVEQRSQMGRSRWLVNWRPFVSTETFWLKFSGPRAALGLSNGYSVRLRGGARRRVWPLR